MLTIFGYTMIHLAQRGYGHQQAMFQRRYRKISGMKGEHARSRRPSSVADEINSAAHVAQTWAHCPGLVIQTVPEKWKQLLENRLTGTWLVISGVDFELTALTPSPEM